MSEITYHSLVLPEERLQPIRKQLYHSSEKGYYIFRNFLSNDLADHIQHFWTKQINPSLSHQLQTGNDVTSGQADSYKESKTKEVDTTTYFNFFWNPPVDEVSYQVALMINNLRNMIMAKPVYNEMLHFGERVVCYRMVITRLGVLTVPPHSDFTGKNFDPRRLQATLFLSEKGKDYTGEGFVLEDNQGKRVIMGSDEAIKSGDLVIWKYNNIHAVEKVQSTDEQSGFTRMIFPPQLLVDRNLKGTIKNLPGMQKAIKILKGKK